ncbi:GNAT family N-acetyltransferase [Roseobacter sinensis]|uniref:GNAT family N-acetyltransferase n=1 Tax=Roseobacter sinensis TaxID=2931391 RepID=A0ABT3BDH8_9RHOB|nr:GNAT family N-acetyltransferase [Roseobacter sp. WL0113]MCV3271639.1 GNAT family N-acetyltransferase [Roseobacter sp. WL0113]
MIADGLHPVPRGKVATIVTHLDMRSKPALRQVDLPAGVNFTALTPDPEDYRDLFRRVGLQEWLWFERMKLSDAEITALVADPQVEMFTLLLDGRAEALLELDFRRPNACELAYFGVTRRLMGQGAGRFLMNEAITRAWDRPIAHFHVHTCTMDSPGALDFYRRSGFIPRRQEVEICDDPRVTGLLPRDAGAHIPIFEP